MTLPLPPQQLLDARPVAIFVVDAEGCRVYANAASAELLGRGAVPGVTPAGLGHVLAARVAGTDLAYPPEKTPLMRALHSETCTVDDMEIVQDRQRKALEVWGAPVRDAERRRGTDHPRDRRLPRRDRPQGRRGNRLPAALRRLGDRRVDHGHRRGPSHFMVVAENVRSKAQAQRLARRLADDIGGTSETSQGLVTLRVTPGVSFTRDPSARPGRMTREADQDALLEELSAT